MKYLFLDFDGVFHGEHFNTSLFCHSKMFCDRVSKYKNNFRIVISSSWREVYSFNILLEAFEKELRDIVIGTTPITINGMNYNGRFNKIKKYCKKNKINDEQWIAIDDMKHLFPNDCENLILTNSSTGITPKNLDFVENFIIS